MLLTACENKNNPTESDVSTPITITAIYGEGNGQNAAAAPGRISYNESGNTISASWESGDQILVAWNGHVNTLSLSSGAGTAVATFTGTISGSPTSTSILSCYVRDVKNAGALTISGADIIYSNAAFFAQDGTLAAAAKCNTYSGMTTYGTGSNIVCNFNVNTSILKFAVLAPSGVNANDVATLTYKSGDDALAMATFTVGAGGENNIYLAVPAGHYTGIQKAVFECASSSTNEALTLSSSQATFKPGETYSKHLYYSFFDISGLSADYVAQDGDRLVGTLANRVKISIADGATVTLHDVNINGSGTWIGSEWAGLTCEGNATIVIEGTNKVMGFHDFYPGIFVPEGKTLTIQGTGSLEACCNSNYNTPWGAGIGSGNFACGNIVIKSGTIIARGGASAGIGCGYSGTCGNILIEGGDITASSKSAPAIGSSFAGTCGNITISGGVISATGGSNSAAIGSAFTTENSYPSVCGNISITTGVTSLTATKGSAAVNATIGRSVNNPYSTCGTITLGCTLDGSGNPVGGTIGEISTSPYTYPAQP